MQIAKIKKRIISFFYWLLISFVLLTCLMVLPFRWLNPPVSMVMVERWFHSNNGEQALQQEWIDWKDIPPELALAVLTAEDQRFPTHYGFDTDAIYDAVIGALNGKSLRGASTISQQVAKNMYLWTDRSWFRKGLEVWFTALIELIWGKQRILEIYLNIAEWGEGTFGVQAAAYLYFDKPVSRLTPLQYALLAVSLPSPLKYNPAAPSNYLIERADWNLQQQKQLGGVAWLQQLQ